MSAERWWAPSRSRASRAASTSRWASHGSSSAGAAPGSSATAVQPALLALDPPPVVDELVAGDPDQPGRRDVVDGAPRDGVDGAHEHLGRDVLGDRPVAAAGEQVAVDLADGVVVEGEQRGALVAGGDGCHGHDPSIVGRRRDSDGSPDPHPFAADDDGQRRAGEPPLDGGDLVVGAAGCVVHEHQAPTDAGAGELDDVVDHGVAEALGRRPAPRSTYGPPWTSTSTPSMIARADVEQLAGRRSTGSGRAGRPGSRPAPSSRWPNVTPPLWAISPGEHVDAFDAAGVPGTIGVERPRPSQLVGRDREVRRRHPPCQHGERVVGVAVDRHPQRRRRRPARSALGRNGRPWVWSQWRWLNRIEPWSGRPSSSAPRRRKPGAGVEHDPAPAVDRDGDARRVPADAGERRRRARRSSRAPRTAALSRQSLRHRR